MVLGSGCAGDAPPEQPFSDPDAWEVVDALDAWGPEVMARSANVKRLGADPIETPSVTLAEGEVLPTLRDLLYRSLLMRCAW